MLRRGVVVRAALGLLGAGAVAAGVALGGTGASGAVPVPAASLSTFFPPIFLGCPNGVTSIAFGAAAGCTIQPGQAGSYTFNGQSGDRIRVLVVVTSGTLKPAPVVRRPNDTPLCTGDDVRNCRLDATGAFVIRVADSNGTKGGTFALGLQRLNAPVGCLPASLSAGTPVPNTIGGAAQSACFTFFATAGNRVRVLIQATTGSLKPVTDFVRPDGRPICETQSVCTLDTTGPHALIVRDQAGPGTGTFNAVICLDDPCGASPTGPAPTTPPASPGFNPAAGSSGGGSDTAIKVAVITALATVAAAGLGFAGTIVARRRREGS